MLLTVSIKSICWRLTGCLVLCLIAGCGNSGAKSLKLDQALARESLVACLESWKKGEQPNDLKNRDPSIIATDPNWTAGGKLLSYRVLSDKDFDDGANLHSTVELTVQSANGSKAVRQVTYIVGTSPVITVFPE